MRPHRFAIGVISAFLLSPVRAEPLEPAPVALGAREWEEAANGLPPTWEKPPGDVSLKISGWAQFRYDSTFRDAPEEGGEGFTSAFQIRRLRITFEGHVGDPSLRYRITSSFTRTGRAEFSDVYVEKSWENLGLEVTVGRFKLPFSTEVLQSSRRLLAVDRSVVNSVVGLDRGVGVRLVYEPASERWRVLGAVSNGADDDFERFSEETTRWAFTGRAEVALLGRGFGRYSTAASDQEEGIGWMVGFAGHAEKLRDEAGEFYSWTADTQIKGYRWTAQAGVIGRFESFDDMPEFHDLGFLVQGGAFVAEKVEAFVRYDVIVPDPDRPNDDAFNTLTAGFNYYIQGQALKFSADVQWFLNSLSDTIVDPSTSIVLLESDDPQVALRLQLLIKF